MKKNSYPGKFIVFEGLDGSGQSTQVSLLTDFLIKKGFDVVTTKEPTSDSQTSKKIRKILDEKEKVPPNELQKLFAQDRKEHLENLIIPALKAGKIVISDRYFFSSLAYGAASGLDLNWLIKLNDNFLLPDLTFLLKVRPGICISRIEKRGNPRDFFEKEEVLSKVWDKYKILPKRFKNIIVINGERLIREVFADIRKVALSKVQKAN
jgi:dTMP kinase